MTQTYLDSQPDVDLRIPADSAYLSVLRTATAALAARLDFTLEAIEDLRIAVDEACALLLDQALPASSLHGAFYLADADLTIALTAACGRPEGPPEDGFSWMVLSSLTTAASVDVHGQDLTVTLVRGEGAAA